MAQHSQENYLILLFVKDFILEIDQSDPVKAADHQLHPLQHVLRRFCSHVAQKYCKKKGHRFTIRQVRQTDLLEIVGFGQRAVRLRDKFVYVLTPGFVALDINVK